jgi:hypothetical protein
MEANAVIHSDIAADTASTDTFIVLLIFSFVGLAVSLLAARYGIEMNPISF